MTNIVERELGRPGIEWVRRGLVGTKLGALLFGRHVLESGIVSALLPSTVSEANVDEFESGVLGSAPTPTRTIELNEPDGSTSHLVEKQSTDTFLVEMIRDFLRQSALHVCVFEDLIALPDEALREAPAAIVTVVDGVVFYVLTPSHGRDTIAAVLREAHKGIHMMVGVFGGHSSIPKASSLDLADVIARLDRVIVDAYDGESYVIWRPRPRSCGANTPTSSGH